MKKVLVVAILFVTAGQTFSQIIKSKSKKVEFTAGNFNNRSDTRDEMANDIFSRQFTIRLSRDTLTQLINYSTNPGVQLMTQDKHLLLNFANQIARLQENTER